MAKNVTLLHSFFCIFRSICLFLVLVFCGANCQNWLKPWFFVSVSVYHNLSKKRPKCRIWSTLLFSPTPTSTKFSRFVISFIHSIHSIIKNTLMKQYTWGIKITPNGPTVWYVLRNTYHKHQTLKNNYLLTGNKVELFSRDTRDILL